MENRDPKAALMRGVDILTEMPQSMLCKIRKRTFPARFRDLAMRLNLLTTTGRFCFRILRKFL